MAIRYLIILSFIIVSCNVNQAQNRIDNIEKLLNISLNAKDGYKIKTFKRNEIKDISYPLIEVRTDGILKQALMLPLSTRNGFSNYTSGDGQNLTKEGAIISKTYGFNVGMLSHKIQKSSHFKYLKSSKNWPNESIHEYEFLTPNFGSKNVFVKCKLNPISENKINIVESSYLTTKFEEKCNNAENDFINLYWVTEDGFVWKSKQWVGKDMSTKEDVFAELFVLKK